MDKKVKLGFAALGLIVVMLTSGLYGMYLWAAPTNSNRFYGGGLSLATGGDGYSIGSDVQLYRLGANSWGMGATDTLTIPALTAGRPLISGTGGLISTDADFTYDPATNTQTVANQNVTGALYANTAQIDDYYQGGANVTNVLKYPQQPYAFTIWNDTGVIYSRNGDTMAVSNGTFTSLLQTAINVTRTGDIFVKASNYTLIDDLTINDKNHFNLISDGAVIKLSDSFTGYVTDPGLYAAFNIYNSNFIKISGFVVDGNKDNNHVHENHLFYIHSTNNTLIEYNIFKNANKNAYYLRETNNNLNTVYNEFIDNGYYVASADIYSSGVSSGSFCFNKFTRNNFTYTTAQAFYMAGTDTFSYRDNGFINIWVPFDFRGGMHTVDGAWGTTIANVLLTQANVKVFAKHMNFTDIRGVTGTIRSAVFLRFGTSVIEDCIFVGSGAEALYGISIRYTTTDNNIIRRCTISGFSNEGIRVENTGGNNLIEENVIIGATSGIECLSTNSLNTIAQNNIFSGVATPYKNTDGTLMVKGVLGYVTEASLTVTNTTATTFVFNHGLAGDIDAAGSHGGVWATFDPTTTAVLTRWSWTSSATQITITVVGAELPATMTAYVYATYKP